MSTLGLVLTHLQQQVTSAISNVRGLIIKMLSGLLGVLTSLKTRFAGLCNSQLSPVVQTLKNIKLWLANQTTVESSIKPEPTIAKVIHTAHGQPQVTTAPQIPQPVTQAQKPRQIHAERTKSGRFAPKGTGVAPTPMASPSQVNGTQRKTVANQHRQRAKQAHKKGH